MNVVAFSTAANYIRGGRGQGGGGWGWKLSNRWYTIKFGWRNILVAAVGSVKCYCCCCFKQQNDWFQKLNSKKSWEGKKNIYIFCSVFLNYFMNFFLWGNYSWAIYCSVEWIYFIVDQQWYNAATFKKCESNLVENYPTKFKV